ncbi:MAG: DUF4912 domain-containing protein [Firmicutes bacterium]|nr:DUF4912 domain-containing protein [Bacillota bacterium]
MSGAIDRMELPQWYDENTLVMLAVSPDTVFLYWEFAFGQVKSLRERQLMLHLYQLPPNSGYDNQSPRLVQNVELPPLTNNWYFNKLEPARRYRAEIGWSGNDRFYSLMKSNTVQVPPAAPSPAAGEIQWQSTGVSTTEQTTATKPTISQTVHEMFDSMSFYMGIKKDQTGHNSNRE